MCYIDVHKFLRMLIGSEKTPMFAFLLFYIKFTSGVITPAAAKARSAQVLRNSPWAMPLAGSELVRPELTCDESALLCLH